MYTIESLLEELNTTARQSSIDPNKWIPCRPMTAWNSFFSLRLKAAWEVFRGRADALKWPEGQ